MKNNTLTLIILTTALFLGLSTPAAADGAKQPKGHTTLPVAVSIDINTANSQSLASGLDGVGPAKAKAIVAYRKAHGPFKKVGDLTRVKGIGPTTVAENQDHIRIQ